ncbi:MAG: flagellar biosynthetic protein FliQ [Myxococcota bacterium]
MSAVLDLARDALMLAVTIGLPLLTVGLAAGVLAGWLGQRTGIVDPAVGVAVRGGAVVLALWWSGDAIATRVQALTDQAWRTLPALGRGGVPDPPGAELDSPPAPR